MLKEKRLKIGIKKAALGCFLVLMGLLGGLGGNLLLTGAEKAYAVPEEGVTVDEGGQDENQENDNGDEENQNGTGTEGNNESENAGDADAGGNQEGNAANSCENSLGAIGWLVCPVTGKLAEAVDWLYERLEGILVINPVTAEDGQPIYEIWKYFLGFTNVVFVIFLLVVIYSQITGLGITNYGIKRSLPKLIVMAVMVNLSFLICSLAVDASNILGTGIRGIFQGVEDSVSQTANMNIHLGFESVLAALGGAGIAVGAAVIAFETGAIWMLIPVVLGAIVAVVVGLITIAMRQAVVALLVMISPLAMVCMILPNTEQWFKKWRQLFFQMLVFYPMFSLLFGASSLAGFAIISSATDAFGLILGIAVQTFPLFFAWQLMKMSGTFLSTVNAKLSGLAARPLGGVRSFAEQQRQLSKQKHLAGRARTPSMRLLQFMANKQVADAAETNEHAQTVKNRGLAYRARRNYLSDGTPSRKGERTYAEMADNLNYQRAVLRDQNNMNRGLTDLVNGASTGAATTAAGRRAAQRARAAALDTRMVTASDFLKAEQARGERIEYENAIGHQERMTRMMNAHLDHVNGFEQVQDENGNTVVRPVAGYRFHEDASAADLARYNAINQIMDGRPTDVQVAAANAAVTYDTQRKIMATKMNKYFDLTVPTKEVEAKLSELTLAPNAVANIDSIVAGLRVLNQRGDLDLVQNQIQNVLDHGLELGTHASQELGNFLMFEVKDRDPFLRRFGKYINLETAMIYSANRRTQPMVTIDEMVRGEYQQVNPQTGEVEVAKSKMGLPTLMLGTPLDGMERKSLDNFEGGMRHAYTNPETGQFDLEGYLSKMDELQTAMMPQIISASKKFLPGSDQIKRLGLFLFGMDENGKTLWDPGEPLAANPELAEAQYRKIGLSYFDALTPTDILGLRSDWREPLTRHLAHALLAEDDSEKWDQETFEKREEYLERLSDIQTRYGDLPAEEAQARREADLKELREEMATTEFRQRTDVSGQREQILRTRRSGAANNAKSWVRSMVGLDDGEPAINEELSRLTRRRTAGRPTNRGESDEPSEHFEEVRGGFNGEDREFFADQIMDRWDDWHYHDGSDVEAFYRETSEYVRDSLQEVGELIVRKYENYYRTRQGRATASELRDELIDLLRDPENYTGSN